jgi:4,5-dihydroxyphthalate decarboxylase
MTELSRRTFLGAAGGVAIVGAGVPVGTRAGARAAGVELSQDAPRITLAGADYLRFTPLATGDLKPEQIALTWLRGPRSEMLRRATDDPEVDGGETSMLGHLLRVDRGDRSLVAVPVFLLRNFTVRDLYTLKGSSLTPRELNGRRVGIYNWAASGAVWYRQLVRYFGQDPSTMKWVVGGIDRPAKVQHRAPLPSFVTDAPPEQSLTDLLQAGDIDAMFAPLPPQKYHSMDGPIVRLVPEYRSVERRYFTETRCYPTQHVLVLRRQVWDGNPSIGRPLVDVFEKCETMFADAQRLFPYNTPWMIAEVEETELLMGPGFHAHGLEKNHHEVDVFCQNAFDDGLTKRRVTVEEYFADFLEG